MMPFPFEGDIVWGSSNNNKEKNIFPPRNRN